MLRLTILNHFPGIHNRHFFTSLSHNTQIMGYQYHGRIQTFLQIVNQAQHLCLDGHIQRGSRFIGKNQLRLANQCDGDDYSLLHTTGKFMRVFVLAVSRNPHHFHHVIHRFIQIGFAHIFIMGLKHFKYLVAHRHNRVQAGHRVLENHGHNIPPQIPYLILVEIQHIISIQYD